jgi:hypothetical protein
MRNLTEVLDNSYNQRPNSLLWCLSAAQLTGATRKQLVLLEQLAICLPPPGAGDADSCKFTTQAVNSNGMMATA